MSGQTQNVMEPSFIDPHLSSSSSVGIASQGILVNGHGHSIVLAEESRNAARYFFRQGSIRLATAFLFMNLLGGDPNFHLFFSI